jgi:hypothetical protein
MKKEVPVFSPAQLADSIMLVYRAALLGESRIKQN